MFQYGNVIKKYEHNEVSRQFYLLGLFPRIIESNHSKNIVKINRALIFENNKRIKKKDICEMSAIKFMAIGCGNCLNEKKNAKMIIFFTPFSI